MKRILIALSMLAGIGHADGPAGWLFTGPYGGAAEIVRIDPARPERVLAAAATGLIYESADAGLSWTHRFFPAQLAGTLHALEIDPRRPNTWYAGVESENARIAGLYKTDDAGRSWTLIPALRGRAVWALALWPGDPNVIAAGTGEGLFLSGDGAATWTRISPESNRELRPVVSIAFHPEDRNTIYAGTTHLPWRTRDGGRTWQSVHAGMLDDSDVFSIAVPARSPSTVYASACSGVYRSADGGSSWRRLATPRGAFRTYLVSPHPSRAGVVFAGTSAGLLRSADGGTAWIRVSRHAVKSIAYDPADSERIYFASSTGGVLLSRDGGTTLVESNTGFSNRNFSAVAGSGNTLFASTIYEPGSGGIFRSDDAGRTWRLMPGPAAAENVRLLAVAPDNPDHVYAAGYGTLYGSSDGGRSWVKLANPDGVRQILAITALPRAGLLAGTPAGLFRLSAQSWTAVKLPAPGAVTMLQGSGAAVAAVGSEGAFRSGDGGLSWAPCGRPAPGASWYGLAFPSADTALAATSQGLFRSADRCRSWTAVRAGVEQSTVSAVISHPLRPTEALAAQFGTVLRTTDGGLSWHALGAGGPNRAYPSALIIIPGMPQTVFSLLPRRGILSIPIEHQEHTTSRGEN